jgi:hypothetical protein
MKKTIPILLLLLLLLIGCKASTIQAIEFGIYATHIAGAIFASKIELAYKNNDIGYEYYRKTQTIYTVISNNLPKIANSLKTIRETECKGVEDCIIPKGSKAEIKLMVAPMRDLLSDENMAYLQNIEDINQRQVIGASLIGLRTALDIIWRAL